MMVVIRWQRSSGFVYLYDNILFTTTLGFENINHNNKLRKRSEAKKIVPSHHPKFGTGLRR